MIKFDKLKYGKNNAVTFSYDDGTVYDKRLIGIFDKYNIKGTFHLTWNFLTDNKHIAPDEIKELYSNHEVSCHGLSHMPIDLLNQCDIINEVMDCRKPLESACGYPVCTMSYPYGRYSDKAINSLKTCGIVASRTTKDTGNFDFPDDYMKWHPTCHHNDCMEYGEKFIKSCEGYFFGPRLFYVWGHSYEFERNNTWAMIEDFCEMISGRDDTWYSTNIEIYRYMQAVNNITVSADSNIIYNPTAIEVWFTETKSGNVYSVKPGETINLI